MANSFGFSVKETAKANIFIYLHGKHPPEPDLWAASLEAVDRAYARRPKQRSVGVVVTEGGGPDSKQRAQAINVKNAYPEARHRALFVTENRLIRGMVTAIGWVLKDVPLVAVAPRDFAYGVAEHLRLGAFGTDLILAELEKIVARVPSATIVQEIHLGRKHSG